MLEVTMSEEEWEYVLKILKDLEDENGFVTFPVSGSFNIDQTENMTFYTDDAMRTIYEEIEPIDASDTSLALDMLKQIGVNV